MTLLQRSSRPRAGAANGSSPAAALDARFDARLFLALWPAPLEAEQLLRHMREWSWPGGCKRVRADRLHLTLHFLGAVDRQRVETIGGALQVPFRPFQLNLTDAAVWRRGLAVLQPTELPAALEELHARLGEALRTFGLTVEAQRFRPHLTLARRAAGAVPPPGAAPLCWQVDGYALVESVLGANGGYQIRRSYC